MSYSNVICLNFAMQCNIQASKGGSTRNRQYLLLSKLLKSHTNVVEHCVSSNLIQFYRLVVDHMRI